MITHIEWAEGHGSTVTRYVWPDNLTTWRSIVLELYGLICDVSGSSCNWIRRVICVTFFCSDRIYCEKTDNETVVEVVSISLSILVTSIT